MQLPVGFLFQIQCQGPKPRLNILQPQAYSTFFCVFEQIFKESGELYTVY